MPDVVRKIEITAALSSDYQAAFKAAADVARDTSKELQGFTKREQDLQRLAALDAQRAAAAQDGNAKAVAKASADYDKLAAKLGMVGKSAADIEAELTAIGEQRASVEVLNRITSRQAELGKTAQTIERLSIAYKKTRDPALLKAIDQQKKKFRELGGAVPKTTRAINGLGASLANLPGPVGSAARSFQGLSQVMRGPTGVVALLGIVGVAAVSAGKKLYELGISAAKAGDKIIKTSDALGISTDAYQELSYAMQRGGASEEDFASGLKTIQVQMGAAIKGQSRAKKAFAQLGISMADVKSMNAEEMFYKISEGIAAIPDPAKRMQTSIQLLGGAGEKLALAMSGGSASLDELRKAARATGNVRTREELEQAAEASDMLLDAQMALKGVMNDIAYQVMPAVTDSLRSVSTWLKDNRDTVRAIASATADMARLVKLAGKVSVAVLEVIRPHLAVITKTLGYWSDQFSALMDSASDFGARIERVFGEDLPNALSGASGFITGLFRDAYNWLIRGIHDLLGMLPRRLRDWLLGEEGILPGAAADFGGSGHPAQPIQVTVAVDARGSDSAAGIRTQRALDAATPVTARAIGDALNQYGVYAGG